MCVCARCLGCGIGHVASLFAVASFLPLAIGPCLVLTAPLLLDWTLQEYRGVESTNWRRLVTGLLAGFGLGALWWHVLAALLSGVL